jgi:hypothetical protein
MNPPMLIKSERFLDEVTGIFQRAELDADLNSMAIAQTGGLTP